MAPTNASFADAALPHPNHAHGSTTGSFGLLTLGSIGVVYGDIGTSPLYALKECFGGHHRIPATPENVIGVMSLVFWSINFVVSFKYVSFVLRADNRGEGGILALLALVRPRAKAGRARALLIGLGLFGAALLYGDGVRSRPRSMSTLNASFRYLTASSGLPSV